VLGLNVDQSASQRAFAAGMGGVPHPILSDFHPKGEVLRKYGVYNEESGTARRSAFIIDKKGIVRWAQLYQAGGLPVPDDVLKELDKIRAADAQA